MRVPSTASAPSSSQAARSATRKLSARRTSMIWRWCLPGSGTSATDRVGPESEVGTMEILSVGGGGREHALAWQCARSAEVEKVYVAPGNAGTAGETGVHNVAIDADDIDGLLEFAKDRQV